jgi:hypothetical protein
MKRLFIAICLTLLTHIPGLAQESISLAGSWAFQTDADNTGLAIHLEDKKLSDRIILPGSMPERLKGDVVSANTKWIGSLYDSSYYFNPYMEKYRVEGNVKIPFFLTPDRHYVGAAWYARTVNIPKSWKNRRVVLFLERPHIETMVWINGKVAGKKNSLTTAHQYDITSFVKTGNNKICIRVYNGVENVGVGIDSHSVTDQTQGDWNGIVGKMELQSSPITYIRDLQVFPDIHSKVAKVMIKIDSKDNKIHTVKLSAELFNTAKRRIISQSYTLRGDSAMLALPMGDDVELWDEFNPALYRLTASLDGGAQKQTTFGMREISIKGKMIYMNGREIMLRGTVENCDFPLTGYAPMDEASWERVFRKCRQYGLNHFRFHSFCPPEAAFQAADIVGFYLQPEGPSWPNHGVKLGNGMPIDKYLMEETKRMCTDYGNHPSFCMLSCGNEPSGNWVAWVSDFVDYWKAADNRRIYTGASVGNGWQWQPKSQYHVKAGARGLTWADRQPQSEDDYRSQLISFKAKGSNKSFEIREPYISHETGQWCAFPDFDEINQYTGVNKAHNFEIFRDILRDNDMSDMAHKFLMSSGKLQALCYKYEIEKTLRTPDYAGFQLLALNDYSGQGTALVGVLNVFFREKGYVDAAQWREFCSPIVPLARMPKFTFQDDETLNVPIEISNFSASALKSVTSRYVITDEDGRNLVSGTLSEKDIPVGSNINIGTVNTSLAIVGRATQLTLTVYSGEAKNHWDFWVYPPKKNTADETGVYITDSLDATAIKTLQDGGKVLITAAGKIRYGKDVTQYYTPVFWNTSWFKMRPPHTLGAYIDKFHPVFADFPTDDWTSPQWWELVNKQQVMQFTEFPQGFQPIIQNIDTWFISRKIGMLFEANVLNGKLMMTTMDITGELDKRIVARQMRKSIIEYMQSDKFRPIYNIGENVVRNLFEKDAPSINMFTKGSPDELKPKIN